MKVLQVNCVYKQGSTGKITYDLHQGLLERGVASVVCYGRGAATNDDAVYKTCSEWYSHLNKSWAMLSGSMYGGCFFSTNKLISVIKQQKPDVVHLQCINGYFVNIWRLVSWLKKQRIKTLVTLHAEFMFTGTCGHSLECNRWKSGCGKCPNLKKERLSLFLDRTKSSWNKMKKAFDGFENVIVTSVSPWLMERAQQSPILSNKKHKVVFNGTDVSIFRSYNTDDLRKRVNVEDRKIVFHATPCFTTDPNHFKGGWYICELAKRFPEMTFIVAGSYERDIAVPKNVILLGVISNQKELAEYYSLADVTVIASKKETFSMVTAESLCCGTPVVGFKAGGPERIALEEYSRFVEYGDLDQLAHALESMIHVKSTLSHRIETEASQKYAVQAIVNRYMECYCELTGEQNC